MCIKIYIWQNERLILTDLSQANFFFFTNQSLYGKSNDENNANRW